MAKFHLNIKANTETELRSELQEASYILAGLQTHLKKWQAEYGAQNRKNLKVWQDKADAWMNKHKVQLPDAE